MLLHDSIGCLNQSDESAGVPFVKGTNVRSKPITRRQISDSSKLKEFADDNFKFHKKMKESHPNR